MSDEIPFRIVPIDAELATRARREQRSPQYGHPATVEVAKGYGPCRQCLRTFRVGEEARLLFTYDPVPKGSGLPQPGPIFIHQEACAPFRRGPAFRPSCAACRSSSKASAAAPGRVRREPVDGEAMEAGIVAMLHDPAIELLQIRNAEAGCFIARVQWDPRA